MDEVKIPTPQVRYLYPTWWIIIIFYHVISSDFFDAGVMPSASLSKDTEAEEAKPSVIADVLPEGFFDDPKQDAKVSNSLMLG